MPKTQVLPSDKKFLTGEAAPSEATRHTDTHAHAHFKPQWDFSLHFFLHFAMKRWPSSLEALAELLLAEARSGSSSESSPLLIYYIILIFYYSLITVTHTYTDIYIHTHTYISIYLCMAMCTFLAHCLIALFGSCSAAHCSWEVRAVVDVSEPLLLAGHSFGATVCVEMARQAEADWRHLWLLSASSLLFFIKPSRS